MSSNSRTGKRGFTLAEVLVGTAVFLIVATGAYKAYVSVLQLANLNQARILAIDLADEQFEIIRNMPYTEVGLTNGIPQGVLPQAQSLVRGGFTFAVTLYVRNVNLATSTLQASQKLVEVDVDCASCKQPFTTVNLTGAVAPANLQSAAQGGALVVQVSDSNGVPIQGATVSVQSLATSSVQDTDITDNSGVLQIIGVPQGVNMYRITATKDGYSTSRTYPLGDGSNPNPDNPDATVIDGQVTQVNLAIDRASAISFSSVTPLCAPVGGMSFHLTGSKEIGPGVPKYSQDLATDGSGALMLSPMEWDTYALTPTDASYDVNGIAPWSPIALNPGATQSVQIVVLPKAASSLMVSVEDAVTKLPVTGASVELTDGAGYDETLVTGQGSIAQTDWSGGAGQSDFLDAAKYAADNGSVDTATSSGDIVLRDLFGEFDASATGTLESSTFDTGTTSNFYSFDWKPINQQPLAGAVPVKFQIATVLSTSTPWDFVGPDGTAATYFDVPGEQISASQNNARFLRYMAYLTTDTATVTPSVSDVSFTFTSGCTPPGQVIFQGLSSGSYTVNVSKAGYAPSSVPVTVSGSWQAQTVDLSI